MNQDGREREMTDRKIVHVITDDLLAALADIDEGREVEWVADDGSTVVLHNANKLMEGSGK